MGCPSPVQRPLSLPYTLSIPKFPRTPSSRSFRCWGRRPSGPPADPCGKDMMASKPVCGVACRGAVEVVGVARRSSGVGGCKDRRLVSVACVAGARVSRELSSRIAPFSVPLVQLCRPATPQPVQLRWHPCDFEGLVRHSGRGVEELSTHRDGRLWAGAWGWGLRR